VGEDEASLAADDEGRKLENTGRPLGDRAFIERLGSVLGRDLVPKKPGSPKRTGS